MHNKSQRGIHGHANQSLAEKFPYASASFAEIQCHGSHPSVLLKVGTPPAGMTSRIDALMHQVRDAMATMASRAWSIRKKLMGET